MLNFNSSYNEMLFTEYSRLMASTANCNFHQRLEDISLKYSTGDITAVRDVVENRYTGKFEEHLTFSCAEEKVAKLIAEDYTQLFYYHPLELICLELTE